VHNSPIDEKQLVIKKELEMKKLQSVLIVAVAIFVLTFMLMSFATIGLAIVGVTFSLFIGIAAYRAFLKFKANRQIPEASYKTL
jgi:hypothetical protein